MKISTSAAKACNKLLAFVVNMLSVEQKNVQREADVTDTNRTGLPATTGTDTRVNNRLNNTSDDPAKVGSFLFPQWHKADAVLLQPLTVNVMKVTSTASQASSISNLLPDTAYVSTHPSLPPFKHSIMKNLLHFAKANATRALILILFSSFAFNAQATRTFSSMTVDAQVGTATYGTASSSITFLVTWNTSRGTGGTLSSGTFSVSSGLPTGASGAFVPTTVSVNSNSNGIISATTTLTITTTTATPAGTFTITVSDGSGHTATGTLTISPKPVTALGTLAFPASKVYDGTTTATPTSGSAALQATEAKGTGTLSDGKPYTGDVVNLTGTAAYNYNSKNVVGATTITASGLSLTGAASTNYTLTAPTFSATITTKALTEGGLTASNKIYNGTNAAALTGTAALQAAEAPGAGTTADGKPYTGDAVAVSNTTTGTFGSVNVANGIAVTPTGQTLTGAQATNYSLTVQTGLTANITQKALTALGNLVFPIKIYDGTTNATPTSGAAALQATEAAGAGTTADGRPYTGDVVSLTGAATYSYNSKDVATANTITINGLSLTGASSINYTLTSLTFSRTISPKALTVTDGLVFPASKPYDGTTTATPTSGAPALQSPEAAGAGTTSDGIPYNVDAVSLTGTAAYNYNSANVTTANTVTVSGLSLTGTGNGNYTATATFPATITPAPLTATSTVASKTYNGSATAGAVTLGTVTGIIAGQPTTGISASASAYSSANVGTYGTTITYTLANSGTFTAANYTMASLASTGSITPALLTITANDVSKVYGNTLAGGAGSSAFTANTQNGETIGTVTINYSTGAAAGDAVGTYNGSVIITPGSYTGGTFNPNNYTITYAPGNITVTALAACSPLNWQEPFTYANGTTAGAGSPVGITTWSLTSSLAFLGSFQVNNNALSYSGGLGSSSAIWLTAAMNLSAYSNIAVSIGLTESINLNAGDNITCEYSTNNGGTWTTFTTNGSLTNDFTSVTASTTVGTAASLILRVRIATSTNFAAYNIDNVTLTGTQPPTPVVNNPGNQTPVCNTAATPAVNFTGTATSYIWTNDNTSIGLGASGIGNIPSFTAVNAGNTTQLSNITVMPSNGTCSGTPQTFTITVNSALTTGAVPTTICAGATVSVPFTACATFNPGNTYTAELSTAAGSWSGNIISVVPVTSSPISVTIPQNTGYGTGYKIRIIASSPATTGAESSDIIIQPTPTTNGASVCQNDPSPTATISSSCVSGNGTLTWYTSGGTAFSTALSLNPINYPGSGLTNTNTVGTTLYYAECSAFPGCRTPTAYVINALPAVSFSGLTASTYCVNNSSVTLTGNHAGNGIGLSGSFTFSGPAAGLIDNHDGTATFNPSAAGVGGPYNITYSYTANGCSNTTSPQSVSVNPVPTATISVNGNSSATVCQNTPVNITFTGAGGTTPYTFNYTDNTGPHSVATTSGNSVTVPVTTTVGGTFSYTLVSVHDASVTACSQSQSGNATVFVNDVNAGAITYSGGQVACFGGDPAIISNNTIGSTTGSGTISYRWEQSPDGVSNWTTVIGATGTAYDPPAGSVAGTVWFRRVTISTLNAVACEATSNAISIQAPSAAVSATLIKTNITCNGLNNGTITFSNPTGGYGTYQYNITGGLVWSSTNTFTGLSAGTYSSLRIRDAVKTGCITSFSAVTIINPAVITASVAHTNASCFGVHDGTVTVTAGLNTGTPPYSYTLSGGTLGTPVTNGTGVFNGLGAGTYSYSVTDINSCPAATGTTTVTEPALVVVNSVSNQSYCNATAQAINFTSPQGASVTYHWTSTPDISFGSGGNGNLSFIAANNTTAPISTTISVTGTLNGCTGNPMTFTVIVNPTPVLSSSATIAAICDGATASYTATSATVGTTFSWSRAAITGINGDAAGSGNSATISETLTNSTTAPITVTYEFTLTADGCSNTQSVTIVVNPTPVLSSSATIAAICDGATASYTATSATVGTTFSWSRAAITGINGDAAGSGNSATISETLTNSTTAPITVTYEFTLTADGCSNTQSVTIVVNPTPVLSSSATIAAICDGATASYTATSATVGATFSWSRAAITGINGDAAGSGNSATISETLTNSTTAPITVTYEFTLTADGCSNTQSVTIVVNPTPVLSSSATIAAICDGATASYTATSATVGATFSWSRAAITGINGDAAGSGNSATISETLTNSTTAPITVTYEFTLTADGCSNAQSVTIVVNPTPVLSSDATIAAICDGGTAAYTATSATTGTAFTWSRAAIPGINGGVAGSGNSATINETLTNSTTAPITVTYVFELTANGCAPNAQSVTIVVNPTPVLSSSATIAAICDGATASYTATSATVGTTFSWSRAAITGINGDAAGSGNSATISETLTNSTTAPITVTYEFTLTADGCSNTQSVTIVVNPTPVLSSSATIAAICDGATASYTATSATVGATFSWSRAAITGINGDAAGSGNSATISETLTNSTTAPITVTYEFTLTADGCSNTQSVTIVVNPTPVLSSSATIAAICDGATASYTATSATVGATFSWSRAAITGINGDAAGSGNSATISETLTNSTTAPITVTYEFTLTADGCSNTQSVTIVVNPTPVLSSSATIAAICDGATASYTATSATVGATFSWSRAAITGINGDAAGSGNSATISETLTNSTTAPITVTYEFTLTADGCSNTQSVTIVVNPTPVLSSSATIAAICDGATASYTATSATVGATFSWSRAAITGINGDAAGSGNSATISETLTNSTTAPITVTYEFTLTADGCSNTQSVTIVVNPTPVLSSSATIAAICDGATASYTATSATVGTTFSWSRAAITGINGDAAGSGNSATISETLTNSTTAPITVTYEFTLTADGCSNTQSVTIVVNPTPVLSSSATIAAICDGATASYTATSATVGTTFSWSRAAITGINGDAAGSGNSATISETLTNSTTAPITVTYEFTLTADGCSNTQSVTIVVNPTPVLSSSATIAAICDGATASYTATSATVGATFSWSRAAITGINGDAAGSGNSATISETLTNSTTAPITVTYEFTLTADGCSNTQSVTIVVNPTPVLSSSATIAAICDGATASYTATSATVGATFSWSRAAITGINGDAAGSGNSATINETLTNSTTAPITVTYVFELTANGCAPNAQSVTIVVNPTPVLSSDATIAAICDGGTAAYTATSATTGTAFTWSRAAIPGINGGVAGSGNSATINETLTNSTTAPITVTYVFELTANGCAPNAQSVTIVVNPTPVLSSDATIAAICDGGTAAYTATSATTGTAFTWSRAAIPGINGGVAGSGNSATINETLTNSTTAPITVTYVFELTANGCAPNAQSVTIVVNPTPVLSSDATIAAICDGGTAAYTATSATTGTAFTWSRAAIPGINGGVAGSGNSATINETLTNSTTAPITVTYVFELTANGCAPNAQSVTIVVNPTATVDAISNQIVCNGSATAPVGFTSNTISGGTITYSWTNDNSLIGLTGSGTGDIGSFQGTNNGIAPITGHITVTPHFTNNSVTCDGTPLTFAITVNPRPTAVVTGTTTICIGTNATLTLAVTGSGTISGSLSDGTTFSGTAPSIIVTVSPTTTTTYTVVSLTDANCTATAGDLSGSATVTVTPDATISLSSPAGTDAQTVCINTPIADIVYAIGGSGTGATVSGLPAGLAYSFNNGLFTISGTPNANTGAFLYSVTTVGPCGEPNITGTITVNANSTINLTSANTTTSQTVCINTPIAPITYSFDGGATTATVTGLPTGVTFDNTTTPGVISISGTPDLTVTPGTYTYTVTAHGPCIDAVATGTITVTGNSTISLTSAGTDVQTICLNSAIFNITYAVGGSGTGAVISAGALPAGVTGDYDGNTGMFTISGTPTVSGTYTFTVTTTGPCGNVSASQGSITIQPTPLAMIAGTAIVCQNDAAPTITFSNAMAMPVTVTYTLGNGTSTTTNTINVGANSTATVSAPTNTPGTYTYTVTSVQYQGTPNCANTITGQVVVVTVNANSTISLSSGPAAQTVCYNTGIATVKYAIGGGATNASITAGALPTGVTGSYSAGIFTISGTPTQSGTFNYTVTTTGPCNNVSLSGAMTVNPSPVVNAISNASYCNGAAGAAISFSSPTTGGTISYSWSSSADVGFGTSGNTNIGAYTATNITNAVITATITVTPHITNNAVTCDGTPVSFTVTVNPAPVVNTVSNLIYCANTPGAAINFSSPVTGGTVTYSWTSTINAGFGLNGTGSIGAFTATNNSINPITATVTVTPSLNGCTGSPISFTVTVNPNANAGAISGSSTLCPGLTAQLSTNGSAGGGWTSSAPTVASVNAVTGMVTALSSGTTTIFYTVSGVCGASTASFNITVTPGASAGTIIGSTTVCVGSTSQLASTGNSGGTWLGGAPYASVSATGLVTGLVPGTATIFYLVSNSCGFDLTSTTITISAGTSAGTIFGTAAICPNTATQLFTTGTAGGTWASSNIAVAMSAGGGFFIGVSPGTATISYTVPASSCGAASVAYFTLTVSPSGNAGTISAPVGYTGSICTGNSVLLSTNGASGGTWFSASPGVATVNSSGLVTAVTQGSAIIYYFVSNTCGTSSATFPVIVNAAPNAGTISGPNAVCTGSSINLSNNGDPGGMWSSNNGSIAIALPGGTVFGIGAGTATITYTTAAGTCGSASASYTVTVNPAPNAGTVSGASTVCAGLSTPFTSTGSTGTGSWSSSNTAVATVNAVTGLVTGVAAGNATITYTATTSCGSAIQSAPITVNPVLNAGTISGGSSVCKGSTINLTTNGNSGGTWSSSNPGIAFVNAATGVVTGTGAGSATITYNLVNNGCGNATATQVVTVTDLPTAGTINSASVCAGLSTSFSSTGGTIGGSWSSSNTAVATVNATSGVVTGVAAGSATITYTVTTSCATATASGTVTVNAVLTAGTISGGNAVCNGSTLSLSASGNSGGTWASTNSSVATIDQYGLVTSLAPGNTNITYTVSNTCGTSTATQPFTVNTVANAGTITGNANVCAGLSTPFTTNGTVGGTWSSSNTAVATVNAVTGIVTGVTAGSATITYTVTTPCGTASQSASITVNSLADAGTISGPNAVCVNASINLSSNITGGAWSTSAASIATVNGAGQVSGVAAGTVTIKYTVTTTCGTNVASYTVTVNSAPDAGHFDNTISTVCVGSALAINDVGGMPGGTWRSSNPARATVDASGNVTGVSAGNAIITYSVTNSCGTSTSGINITVNSLPNAGTISGASAVCAFATINLSASGDAGGTWTSTAPGIATVDINTGVVTGVAAGTTTIIYTVGSTDVCGTASATHLVTVNPVPYAGTITGGPTVCAGLAISLTSSGSVGGTWTSSNPAAATVNASTGLVTGVAAGTTTITYTVSTATCGSATAVTTITVSPLLDAGTINGPSSVCTGASINLTSTGSTGGTWSSSNGGVAYVDPYTGQVTAGALPGNTTITYTVSNSCITSSATKVISVNAIPTGGTVFGASTLCIGASTQFTSNGTPAGTWSSSNTSVATVNSVTGVVTGVAAGNATIVYTVSSSGCGIATAQATIAVNPGLNAGTISGATSVCVNATIILSSTSSGGTWSSNNTGIATVDGSTGIVTGVAGGSTSIIYTVTTSCGTSSASYPITVNPLPNAGTIGGTLSVCIGSTTALTSNGNSGGTWSSSNTSAATVNASTGVVTGVAAGSTTITYTVTSGSGCGQASISATVTVNALPAAGTVSGVSALCVGNTTTFTSNGTGGGSWSSNNTAAATVNATTGEVTGVAAGSATITYTVTGTCGSASSSANITISAIPLAGNISGTTTLCAGATSALTSNGTGGGSWSSNNSLVATVNAATGVVTAVGPGSATITYMVTNSCGTTNATAIVTVNALPNAGTVSGAATLCVTAQTSFTSNGDGGGSWSSSNTAIATVNASTGLVTGGAAGSATITYTATSANCGSQTASANITIKPLPVPGIINGSSTVCVNGTTPFTSTGDAGGSWTSNNPAVATVNASTGVVTGVAAGSTTIMYSVTNSCATLSATKVIIVNPLANAGVISGPATVCMGGTSTAFTSSGDVGGVWSSSSTAIATVDVNGVVSGVATGNANIIYTVTSPNGCGTATASAAIAVITLPNAGTITGSSTVCIGATTTYSDAVSGGTWSSQAPSIATVDAGTGVVTGVAPGDATITYTVTNSCGSTPVSKTITVNAVPNAGTVSGAATVCVNGTATFTTTGAPAGGSWSSSNTAIATVNPGTGLVTGVAAGTTNIIYTSTTPCGTTTASAPITVLGTPSAGTINGLTAVCMGTSPTYTNAVSGGTWSSTSTGMATINAATGVLTTLAPGNTTIQYTVSNGCNTSVASLLITVNPLANAGTVSGASTVCAGAQATFTTNSTVVTNGTTITGVWSSSNTAAATVNASTGVVTGVAAGTANIIYTSTTPCGTATASAAITVNPVLTAGTVSGAAQLCIGSTTTYTSSGSAGGSWSSLTPSVATVNASTGVITGVSAGNATITYTITSGCGAPASSSKVIAVSAGSTGTLSGSSTVCSGDYVTFTRSGGTSGGTWSSSNTSVATVSNSGRVTGVLAGTAVISYTVTSGCGIASTTKSITVSSAPDISVTNITASTDPNSCSALVTLGSNVTITGSPATVQYRIGYFWWWFSYQIPSTYTFPRGTTPVIVIATNSCGSAYATFKVTVVDNTPPTITCKPNATRNVNGNSSRYSVHGHEFDATATDGCGIASLVYSLSGATVDAFERENTSLSNVRLNIGTTTITWKATDVNGNVSTCSFTVTVTHSGGSANPPEVPNAKVEMFAAGLTVNVAPNPTSNYFTLSLNSIGKEKIKLNIVDVLGRPVEKMTDITPNSTVQIGGKYRPGVYMVQAIQGQQTVVLKLIKEGN